MATIIYTITGGTPNYTATLTPSSIPAQLHTTTGTYQFNNVLNGVYILSINDANECLVQQTITVIPLVTTTTTTIIANDSIVVGNAQYPILIFDQTNTNINVPYVGDPDPNTVLLYLWFKTKDGKPLTLSKQISYNISSNVIGTLFTFNGVSDEVHTTVNQVQSVPSFMINGTITFQVGFIESYFAYTFQKIISSANYDISLSAISNLFDQDISTINTPPTYIYGVNLITPTLVNMNFA